MLASDESCVCELWVCLRDSASLSKVAEWWLMISDINLCRHMLGYQCVYTNNPPISHTHQHTYHRAFSIGSPGDLGAGCKLCWKVLCRCLTHPEMKPGEEWQNGYGQAILSIGFLLGLLYDCKLILCPGSCLLRKGYPEPLGRGTGPE